MEPINISIGKDCFQIREVSFLDNKLMNEIYKLRVLCRNDAGFITFEKYPNGLKELEDATGSHLAVFHSDFLMTSIRLNYYNNRNEHPFFNGFIIKNEYSINTPFAYMMRGSVNPGFQHLGIWTTFLNYVENYLKTNNFSILLGDTLEPQTSYYQSRGYSIIGKIDVSKINNWKLKPINPDIIRKILI